MDNKLNNASKGKKIFDFLMGFLGPVILLWLFFWFPKLDLNNITKTTIVVLGLLFTIIFVISVYKNTYAFERWYGAFEPKNKNTYISKGLIFFSVAMMAFVFLFILYCIIVPAEVWPWNHK